MIFTAQHPGSWQEFMMRPENKALPIQEATRKYNSQMLMFENQYSTFIQQQQQMLSQRSSGRGPRQTPPRPFILEYTIVSPNTTVSIPLGGANFTGYDFTADWGDGESTGRLANADGTQLNAQMVHTYTEPGVYEVTILGRFPYLNLNTGTNKVRLTDIKQWGTTKWESFITSFRGCTGLTNITVTDAPDLTRLKTQPLDYNRANVNFIGPGGDLTDMFRDCSNLSNINFMLNWDMSQVRVMDTLFRDNTSLTDWSGLQNWNTSNIINMYGSFQNTPINSSDLQYLSNWNISKTEYLIQCFSSCTQLTNIDALVNWNTSNVITMRSLFNSCRNLTDISGLVNWNTSNVTTMRSMFTNCDSLVNVNALANWDVSNVTTMSFMFGIEGSQAYNGSLTSLQGLQNWDVSSVTAMNSMFQKQPNIIGGSDISNWNTNSLLDISFMFTLATGSSGITSLDLSFGAWDINQVTNMNSFMQLNNISTANYDDTLIGWAAQIPLSFNGTVNFGTSKYTPGGAAEAARTALIADVGAIIDGGAVV